MRPDPNLCSAASRETPIPAGGGTVNGLATATMRKTFLAGLGLVLALPAAAQTAPQEAVTQELEQGGFTNIQVAPGSFVLHATDKAGRAVTLIVDPAATPALPPATSALPQALPPDVAPASTASAAAPAATRLSDREKQFLITTAQSSDYESALSRVAVARAAEASVKQYAQQVVSDHEVLARTLQAIAGANGVSLPQTPSPDQQIQLSTFLGLTGDNFDHTYLQEMARIETLNKRNFDLEASLTANPALKSFAQDSAPAAARRAHQALVLNVTP